jgi:hypothetical protein
MNGELVKPFPTPILSIVLGYTQASLAVPPNAHRSHSGRPGTQTSLTSSGPWGGLFDERPALQKQDRWGAVFLPPRPPTGAHRRAQEGLALGWIISFVARHRIDFRPLRD